MSRASGGITTEKSQYIHFTDKISLRLLYIFHDKCKYSNDIIIHYRDVKTFE